MGTARVAAGLAAAFTAVTAAATLATAAPAAPARTHAKQAKAAGPPPSDVREVPPGKRYSTERLGLDRSAAPAVRAQATADTPPVGTVRQWIALDDAQGRLYRKDYTLRGVGAHIEVWVANDLAFPEGDCRTPVPATTEITDEQVQHLITEFDSNIYPKETSTFSTPPDRDGTGAQLGPDANGNGGVYTGAGDKTVTLVDNVRDDNFYEFPAHPTYIAGFFSSQFNDLVDRNVMTVDAFDWAHRTTADPPDEPTDDLCTSRPARQNLYEGTFAHEWQHLLQHYTDPIETVWLNEGLSDFAQTLTGYVDASATVFDRGADSHIYCFQGFGIVRTPFNPNPRDCGGPENSLNLWGEGENPDKLLADYGNAYSFLLFLFDRYGIDFITRLHNDGDLQGLASTAAALQAEGAPDLHDVLHDYQSMVLLDKIIGDAKRAVVRGVAARAVTTPSLRSAINVANPDINDDPGAAPNGADYVPLVGADGQVLAGRTLRSLSFAGAQTLPALSLAWTTVADDPDRPGNPVLWSGNASNTDASAVTQVTVPAEDPTLRFLAKYGAEQGFDYGYVQVSTDGGATYTTVPGDSTVAGPLGPGLNGTTTGFEPRSYDLSAYAGQTILIAIRYVSDGGVNEGGLLVDDLTVGGTTVSDGSSLDPFRSPTQIHPTAVHNWNLRLVGITARDEVARIRQFEADGITTLRLKQRTLRLFRPYQSVVAIVAYGDPSEQVQQYAPYTLSANGVAQRGGTSSQ
jgi:hypothetical protein